MKLEESADDGMQDGSIGKAVSEMFIYPSCNSLLAVFGLCGPFAPGKAPASSASFMFGLLVASWLCVRQFDSMTLPRG